MMPNWAWTAGWPGRFFRVCLTVVLGVIIGACGRDQPAPAPAPPTTAPALEGFVIPPYAKYLEGLKICLDPGHGGRADRPNYKRGPTGLQEAEVNLKVALFLREFLESAAAQVFMTRTQDIYLHEDDTEDLRLRAEVANSNNCDLLLSIHHNAGENPDANFTSIWYHADVDRSPASLDIARYVSVALIDALDLPQTLGCPVVSDQQIFERSGFAILRQARVPAILSEASFHSNPAEEQRLRDPEYNRREAHALFLGLARYAYGGVPKAVLTEPDDGVVSARGRREIIITLDDGLSSRKSWGWQRRLILRDSIFVRHDGKILPFTYDEKTDHLKLRLPTTLKLGPVTLHVQFQNLFKHNNIWPTLKLQIGTDSRPD